MGEIAVRPFLSGLEREWAVGVLDDALAGPLQARRNELELELPLRQEARRRP